jgi:predicted membrane-bound spermidine synthase
MPLLLIFFLSGVAGLLFETVWFRLAGLSLGNTVWTSSIVLAAFMGGLGLGNAAAAWRGSSIRRPLRAYGLLELLVGGFGMGAVLLLPHATAPLRNVLGALAGAPLALHLLRLGVAFTLMLVPAAAMGLTLPLLVKNLQRSDRNYGRALGRLYGWNTIGGVAGALAGELWLVPRIGVQGTGAVAAALNATAGVTALLLARHLSVSPAPPDEDAPAGGTRPQSPWSARRYLLAAALAGGLLLALEVVWYRFLQLYVQGTALAFAVMLATILLGIGFGGLLAGRLSSWGVSGAWLVAFACWAGTSTSYLYATFDPRLHGSANFLNDLRATLWLSFRLMFPTALASGVLFTYVGRALHESLPDPARATGWLAVANTAGATLGALAGGFVLLPGIGMERSIFALSLGYAFVAALCWKPPTSRSLGHVTAGSALAFALLLALFPFGLLQNHFLRITLRHFECTGAAQTLFREGVNETILLLRFDWGGRQFGHRLVTNGLSMSGTYFQSQRYMKLFAYWAFAVKHDIRRALLISYGMGNTAVALKEQAGLRSADVVDVSREILGLAETIYTPETNPLRDPRFRVHLEDGRFFLWSTDETYDLITGEPPPPKIAGVANLYSREFFQLVHERLKDGGIVTYWLPIHQLTQGDARSILRGFCDVFPSCSLWNGCNDDWIMVGVRGSLGPSPERAFTRLWEDPGTAEHLVRIGVEVPEQLGALFIADAPRLQAWIGDALPLVDDRPGRLSLPAPGPEDLAALRALAETGATSRAFAASAFTRTVWPPALRQRTADYFGVQQALNDGVWSEDDNRLPDLHRILTTTRLRVAPLLLLQREPRHYEIVRDGLAAGDSAPGLRYELGLAALVDRQFEEAARLLASVRDDPARPQAALYEAFALVCGGRKAEAAQLTQDFSPAVLAASPPGSIAWLAAETSAPMAAAPPGTAARVDGRSAAPRP